ncbi:MAG: DUF4419 domain-containing protein [Myxococcales bacterium]|nr:DUF4419 domain-containing protein [Myxococcales bacterium]
MSFWPFRSKTQWSKQSERSCTFGVDSVSPNLDRIALDDPRARWKSRGLDALEALDKDDVPYVVSEPLHGLIAAVHLAYDEHRPLVLTPDDALLCMLQALGRVIEESPEKHRSMFVSHEGKQVVRVQRDEFVPGSPDNDWAGTVTELSSLVRKELSDEGRAIVSGTGRSETATVACDITMLGAMQNYFELEVHTMCGIPSITLEGTAREWQALVARAKDFERFGLRDWSRSLTKVLERFVAAATGDVDVKFWREIYKREDASGGPHVSGWIHAFFPFLGDRGTSQQNRLAHYGAHWPSTPLEAIGLASLPPGLASAPFVWQVLNERVPMSFVAGFTGVTQDPTGAVRARIGWAIAPRVERRRFSVQRNDVPGGVPTLYPRPGERFMDCQGVADEAKGFERWGVEFPFAGTLVTLDGLQSSAGLVSIGTLSTNIPTLAPLEGHPTLERLWIHQDSSLVDVRAVASLPALKQLAFNHCDKLVDFSPLLALESHPHIQELILHGKTVPRECIGVHKGRDAVMAVLAKLRASRSS